MTSRTFCRVASLTCSPPFRTRETVPVPTPASAATSGIVGRSGVRTGTSHSGTAHVGNDSNLDWIIVTPPKTGVKGAFAQPSSRQGATGRVTGDRPVGCRPAAPALGGALPEGDVMPLFSKPAGPGATWEPEAAEGRLAHTAGSAGGGVFTSDLSVS